MSYNFGMRTPFPQRDLAFHPRAIEQRGYDADLLGDVFARAAAAGWTVGIQRLDLVADNGRFLARLRTAGDAQPDLIGLPVTAERGSVQRRAADEINAQLIEA